MDQETKDEIYVRLHQVKEILDQTRSTKLERKFALLHIEQILKIINE